MLKVLTIEIVHLKNIICLNMIKSFIVFIQLYIYLQYILLMNKRFRKITNCTSQVTLETRKLYFIIIPKL